MESKNVKVIDEHGIDRDANIICAFDLDGSDYVTYWIERDTENDNIFVSKLIKNIDGTSNMLNIDDMSEKDNISQIVRELVKYAVGDEADKLVDATLTLPSGKSIKISSVLFNKEQNINVQRTYITTVKKSVTKVSEEFYNIKIAEEVKEPVAEVVTPVVEPIAQTVEPVLASVPSEVVPVEANDSVVSVPTPVETVEETVVPEVTPVVEPVKVESVVAPGVEEPIVEPTVVPTVSPVLPVKPVSELQTEIKEPVAEVVAPVVEPILPEPTPLVEDAKTANSESVEEVKEVKAEPVVLNNATNESPAPVVMDEAPKSLEESNKLIFDGSKETNFNKALEETTVENQVPVSNIEPIREFGIDDSKSITPEIAPMIQPEPVAKEDTKVLTKKMGFANNKFFMVIAIAFFMASCVFLGYEVFQFFQLR